MRYLNRRHFLRDSAGAVGFLWTADPLRAATTMVGPGQKYEATVPDTLDLAERARLAINPLISSVDPNDHYNMYFLIRYTADPPYMLHMDIGDFLCCNPKWAESLPLLRAMSGSEQGLDIEEKLMQAMIDMIDPDDGLFYLPPEDLARKPWYKRGNYPPATEPITNVYGDARMMLAMMAWYYRDQNPVWLERLGKMANGLGKVALYKDDYAYYPEGKVGMEFSYLKYSGYNYKEEPQGEHEGAEGSVLVYHGGQIRALARWYSMSGDKKALDLAAKLSRFLVKRKLWGAQVESKWIEGPEHAHFDGHHHGACIALRGLLEYANVADDQRIKEFVRDGYECSRSWGIGRIGCFGSHFQAGMTEGCSIADMVALAIRLSDYGVGDYWDDADQYVRNQLAEVQLVRADLLENVSRAAVKYPEAYKGFIGPQVARLQFDPEEWEGVLRRTQPQKPMTDRVVERNVGNFAYRSSPTTSAYPLSIGCCTGNLTQALYYAWESIVRCKDGDARVNLLLNRASPWLDVDSYLPYEGKVVIKNKTATRLGVRIPRWVDKKAVRSRVNERTASTFWVENYLMFDKLSSVDSVTIEFPMAEETVKYTMPFDKEYTCTFKGNTLVDILPRDNNPTGYPFYQRSHYRQDQAPLKSVARYVSNKLSDW